MVQVQRQKTGTGCGRRLLVRVVLPLATCTFCFAFVRWSMQDIYHISTEKTTSTVSNNVVLISTESSSSSSTNKIFLRKQEDHNLAHCSYKSLADLKEYELVPVASKEKDGNHRRHMVDPPKDTGGSKLTLVCCQTTAGQISIAVHEKWAPIGAARFLDMVKADYFSSRVALMRCIHNFICQFGIAGIPSLNKSYKTIKDDPNWLPEGPTHKTNEFGTKRFSKGYFAYAGGGKNSRSNQLIVALNDNARLGGGSPWEVPFGEAVGTESFNTLSSITTKYGEKGPPQGHLMKVGSSPEIAELFPDLDYIISCSIVDEREIN
mmetsp:Transcript_23205/g.33941  ORF Transcript_23205/g.33941 Transcript_23205/m.33941 type:complete len:320 (+) Transcript_23205:49-1008(+)|eukprot:CAMPEP_0197239434 /NCGR_PEP_ID=MMETSP1429-20130617/5901_1 /TAXON_ID=49237 /ORGANISM="Chaetoceros  sp., Strain UNC1202" /LENGTH=319 /DNA_ID=CAMNT_0042698847 /DNA_START=36 /DNA_END=995 /DNA_ORIENTATION=+